MEFYGLHDNLGHAWSLSCTKLRHTKNDVKVIETNKAGLGTIKGKEIMTVNDRGKVADYFHPDNYECNPTLCAFKIEHNVRTVYK